MEIRRDGRPAECRCVKKSAQFRHGVPEIEACMIVRGGERSDVKRATFLHRFQSGRHAADFNCRHCLQISSPIIYSKGEARP